MLIAKMEIWPHGRVHDAYEIGRLFIANQGPAVSIDDELGTLVEPHNGACQWYTYATWKGEPNSVYFRVPATSAERPVHYFTHDRTKGADLCVQLALGCF